jgi:hypothetical protein
MTGTLREDLCPFMIVSRSVLLRMRNVLDKSCAENQNTHFKLNNFFFFKNRVVYQIMWKDMVQPGQDTHDNIIWRIIQTRDQKHLIHNCFSTARMVMWSRQCPLCPSDSSVKITTALSSLCVLLISFLLSFPSLTEIRLLFQHIYSLINNQQWSHNSPCLTDNTDCSYNPAT